MTFYAILSFRQPETPLYRRGFEIDAPDAKIAVSIISAYITGFTETGNAIVDLDSLTTRKPRGVDFERLT